MKKNSIFLLLFFSFLITWGQKKHIVKKGEYLSSIGRMYYTFPSEIIKENPFITKKNGLLQPQDTLIIPTFKKNETVKIHKVRKKDNLYRISKKYKVSQEDIIKLNFGLTPESLKKDQYLRIPRRKKDKEVVPKVKDTIQYKKYRISKNDSLEKLSKKHNQSVAEIYAKNPNLAEGGLSKMKYLFLREIKKEIKTINYNPKKYKLHKVTKGETVYRIAKNYNINKEDLLKANTGLTHENLALDSYILIPLNIEKSKNDSIQIAIIQNFKSNKFYDNHSSAQGKSLRYYMGSEIALRELAQEGTKLKVKVFDYNEESSKIKSIAKDPFVQNADIIFAPMDPNPAGYFALLVPKAIVVSPYYTKQNVKTERNLVRSRTDIKYVINKVTDKIKKDHKNQDIIITQNDNEKKLSLYIGAKLLKNGIKKSKIHFSNQPDTLQVANKNYQIILATVKDNDLATKIIKSQSSIHDSLNIKTKVYGIHKYKIKDKKITNDHLYKIKYTYGTSYNTNAQKDAFIKKYKELFVKEPNSYAILGYDVTKNILSKYKDFENLITKKQTTGLGHYFDYKQEPNGGYYNTGAFLIETKKEIKNKEAESK